MTEAVLGLDPESPAFFPCLWNICVGLAAESHGVQNDRQATVLRHMLCKCTKEKREKLLQQELVGMTLLGAATAHGTVDVLKEVLAANGGRTDNGGQLGTALHYLRQRYVWEKLRLLIEHGADVNAVCSRGETVLHNFAYHACLDSMEECIHAGAAVDKPNSQGESVLHLSIGIGNESIAEMLLQVYAERNLPLDAKDDRGFSALQLAVYRRSVSLTSLVLNAIVKRGLDAFDVDPDVPCPLATAARRGPLEIVKLLLQFAQPSPFRIKRAIESAHEHKPAHVHWIIEHLKDALERHIEVDIPDTD